MMFAIILCSSLGTNILFLSPYIKGKLSQDNTEFFDGSTPDNELLTAVVNASTECDESNIQMIQSDYRGLRYDIKALFAQRNSATYNNFYLAYNYVGLSYYALKTKDPIVIDYLTNKADSWISDNGHLNYCLTRVDQCPIGILYINLFKITNDPKYKSVADFIFDWLKSKRLEDNLIPYTSNGNHYVDAVGMYVPFLMEYYYLKNDSLAKIIAEENIRLYQIYATDNESHIPYHGYNIKTKIKLGSCNWGRGIGWYLLAVSYCPQMNDSILSANIDKLNYTQFPLSSNCFDSSTALMFEIYKQSTTPQRKLNLDFIRTHVRRNGYVSDCSGDTYDYNDYSHSFGNSELCNGLLLLLVSKFSNNS